MPAVLLRTDQSTTQSVGTGHGCGAGVVDASKEALPLSMQLGDGLRWEFIAVVSRLSMIILFSEY